MPRNARSWWSIATWMADRGTHRGLAAATAPAIAVARLIGETEARAVEFLDPGDARPAWRAGRVHLDRPLDAFGQLRGPLEHRLDRDVPFGQPVDVGDEVEDRLRCGVNLQRGAPVNLVHGGSFQVQTDGASGLAAGHEAERDRPRPGQEVRGQSVGGGLEPGDDV